MQVLGCSKPNFKKTQAILLIGSGRFHAISLATETNLPIYILERYKLTKISEEEINNLKSRKKAAYLNCLQSDKVGLLVSTKPGQENLKDALSMKKKLKNKSPYLFIGNNFVSSEFENLNFQIV